MDNELISIITQTNNNDKGLTKIYESLIQNSGYGLNLEWLILNNGQTDEIYEIVEYFENLEDLKIKYIHIPNLKQNECLNYLIESSEGAYVLECKDNEYFTQNGLRKVKENIFPLPNIYGFVFVNKKYEILENQEEKVLTYNTLKSNVFTDEYLNQNLNMFEIMLSKFNLEGDENLENYTIVYNNNIRKKVNLLLQENETYITKKDIFNLLDKRGYVFCFNDIIKYYEESNLDQTQLNNEIINNIYIIDNNIYLDDEILNNILTEEEKKYLLNPKGYFKYFENFFSFPFETGICKINKKTRTHYIKKYLLSAFLSGKQININKIKDKTNKFLINLLKPYAYIEYKLKGYLSKRDKYENI